ncbi:MAG TPA: hypothetical protein PKD91_05830, partial [Bacteroidia bacterium]|nr:hypothetical protein [Bacteroidia bacterium]
LERKKFYGFTGYQDFKFIRLPVSFLRGIDPGIDVIHDPEFKQYPPLIGDPNNSAHALLTYSEEKHNDPEVLIEIVDYVGNNYDNAVFKPDLSSVDNMIDFYNNMFFNKSE